MRVVLTLTTCLLASAAFSTSALARHSHQTPNLNAHARPHVAGLRQHAARHTTWRHARQGRELPVVEAADPGVSYVTDERYGPVPRVVARRGLRPAAPAMLEGSWPNSGDNGFASFEPPPPGERAGRRERWAAGEPWGAPGAAFPPYGARTARGSFGGASGGSVGIASFYSGGRTASGERVGAMTAAHRSLPFGTMVRVTNLTNGSVVTVRINDRGPFTRNRAIDLSSGAARAIGMIGSGVARVRMDVI